MNETIGTRIKTRRKELHITQTQIQEQTSITSGHLSCIEHGKYLPSAIALMELSKVLDCSVDWILTGHDYPTGVEQPKILDILDFKDKELLTLFHNMDEQDQEELLAIAQLKCNKRKQTPTVKSFHSSQNDFIETA